jgi:hypothetical protein
MGKGMDILVRDQAVTRPLTRVLVGTRGLFGSCSVWTRTSWAVLRYLIRRCFDLRRTTIYVRSVSTVGGTRSSGVQCDRHVLPRLNGTRHHEEPKCYSKKGWVAIQKTMQMQGP